MNERMIFDGSYANFVNSAATFMDDWRLVPDDILGYHIVGEGYLEDYSKQGFSLKR